MKNTVDDGIKYADDVISGKILAAETIIQSCKKFKADLKECKKKNSKFIFSRNKTSHFLGFVNGMIKHVKGGLSGEPFILSPWQVFIACNLFGFVLREDNGIRRFKNCLLFVSRKAGKSALSSILPIYELLTSGEGVEIYSVATKRDQAKIVWSVTKQMIKKLPKEIKDYFQLTINQIRLDDNFGVYTTLGRDSESIDGLNPSLSIFDEASSIKDRNLVEVVTSATGSRENYLNVFITTASFTKDTIFYENLQYCRNILNGSIEDDTWFSMIYENSLEDFENPETWVKSNPNIGVSLKPQFLKDQWNEAKQVSNKKANFLVKYLNIYQSASSVWLPTNELEQNYVEEIDKTLPLYIGVDLGVVSDLTAVSFVYVGDNGYEFENICLTPKESINKVPRYLQTIYANAVKEGELILMPGKICDLEQVSKLIVDYVEDKNLIEVCYDVHNSNQLIVKLEKENIVCEKVSQKMVSLSPAAKELERSIIGSKCKAIKNKFFEWQFSNTTSFIDVNNNMKLRKGDDNNLKIDSVIALTIALSKAMDHNSQARPTLRVVDF